MEVSSVENMVTLKQHVLSQLLHNKLCNSSQILYCNMKYHNRRFIRSRNVDDDMSYW